MILILNGLDELQGGTHAEWLIAEEDVYLWCENDGNYDPVKLTSFGGGIWGKRPHD